MRLPETLRRCRTASPGSKSRASSQRVWDPSCTAHFPPDNANAPGSTCSVLTLCHMYETRCHVQSRTRHISETSMVDASYSWCLGADGIVFASSMITASVALCIRLKFPGKGPSHVRRYPDDSRRYRLFGRLSSATAYAISLARALKARLSLLHVVPEEDAAPDGHPCLSAIRGDA